MKTTTIETTGFDALGIQTTTTTTTQFQVANVGFANMLNNQFRDWDSCEVGNFLISPSISFNDNGNIKTVNLPPMGKMIEDQSGRKAFYCTYRQASSIAQIHEQGIEWNREKKFLFLLTNIIDSSLTPKVFQDAEGNDIHLYKFDCTIKYQRTVEGTDLINPEMQTVEVDGYMEVRIPDFTGGNPTIKILASDATVDKVTLEKVNNLASKFAQKFNVTM